MIETETQNRLPTLSPEQKLIVKYGPDNLRILGRNLHHQMCEGLDRKWSKIGEEHVGPAVVETFNQLIQSLMVESDMDSTFDPKNPIQPHIEKVADPAMPFAWETLISDETQALAHDLCIDVLGDIKGI